MSVVTSGSDSVVVGIVHITAHLVTFDTVCSPFSSHSITIASRAQELGPTSFACPLPGSHVHVCGSITDFGTSSHCCPRSHRWQGSTNDSSG